MNIRVHEEKASLAVFPRPRLSAVIVAGDESRSLEQVLRALTAQKWDAGLELIVVEQHEKDDATPNTMELCERYGATRIPLAREASYGKAINAGIEQASGELVLLLRATSLPIGTRFLEQATAPFDDPNVAAARCLLVTSREQAARWYEPRDLHYASADEQQAAESGTAWERDYPSAGCCVLRHGVWQRVPFDESLEAVGDKRWASQVLSHGYKIRSCVDAPWIALATLSKQDERRKRKRETLGFYRISGHAPLTWPSFFALSLRAVLAAPFVGLRHALEHIAWYWHLVTIPLQARLRPAADFAHGVQDHNGNVQA